MSALRAPQHPVAPDAATALAVLLDYAAKRPSVTGPEIPAYDGPEPDDEPVAASTLDALERGPWWNEVPA